MKTLFFIKSAILENNFSKLFHKNKNDKKLNSPNSARPENYQKTP